jgi:two-component system cell cycle response regulator
VEDEAIVARDIVNTLALLGYSVAAVAASAEAAIESATTLHPDLVLMDIRLQGPVDGVKAAREITDRLGLPVVFLTAHADEQTLRRAKITQPLGYILKPFDDRDLQVAIEMALYRHRAQMTLRRLAIVDELTGLYNRRGFLNLAKQHLKLARRAGQGFWIVLCDVDGLKYINDTFGHNEGDRALVATADILKKTFRESDILARLGGDEFTVLAIHAADDSARSMMARLQGHLEHLNGQNGARYALALSVGLARFDPTAPTSLEDVMSKADEALYEDKHRKRTES